MRHRSSSLRRHDVKRLLIVFTNKKAIVGPGLNLDLKPEEKERLRRVMLQIKTEVIQDFGTTVTMAEYPKHDMAIAGFLAREVLSCEYKGFVRLRGFIEDVDEMHKSRSIETLILCCLSSAPDRPQEEAIYPKFVNWWNTHCFLFGMSMIPQHVRDGDGSVLLIDYQSRTIEWLMYVGEPSETKASTTV